tara:strand:- start:239 stop:721 length:483 start_codon:yes stop_codon:yes gene_type:complete
MTAFDEAWDVVKKDITWDQIWMAGKLKEAGEGSEELIKLIRRLDGMGASYSAERKAVDLMLNSGWKVKETQDRMGQTSQGNQIDHSISEELLPFRFTHSGRASIGRKWPKRTAANNYRRPKGFLNPVDWAEVEMDEEAEGVNPRLTGDDDEESMFREEFE